MDYKDKELERLEKMREEMINDHLSFMEETRRKHYSNIPFDVFLSVQSLFAVSNQKLSLEEKNADICIKPQSLILRTLNTWFEENFSADGQNEINQHFLQNFQEKIAQYKNIQNDYWLDILPENFSL